MPKKKEDKKTPKTSQPITFTMVHGIVREEEKFTLHPLKAEEEKEFKEWLKKKKLCSNYFKTIENKIKKL